MDPKHRLPRTKDNQDCDQELRITKELKKTKNNYNEYS